MGMTINTKFRIGDTFFYKEQDTLGSGKVVKIEIAIDVNKNSDIVISYHYIAKGGYRQTIDEKQCYVSKEELIATIVKLWEEQDI